MSTKRQYLQCAVLSLLLAGPIRSQLRDSLEIRVNDVDGKPLASRIHLRDRDGDPVRPDGLPFFRDHFVFDGRAKIELAPGKYRYEIERGPEYERLAGDVTVKSAETAPLVAQLERITNLRKQGWYSGDLHVHRPLKDIVLLMEAEDLDFAPVITWWNNQNVWKDKSTPRQTELLLNSGRIYTTMAGEDEREGGALLYFGLKQPLELVGSQREFPSPMKFVNDARKENSSVWIDIEKPFWWDVPVWIASGKMNSIGLANNHMCRRSMYQDEAWGRPRDAKRLPPPRGNGYWTQEIYYHLLNAGIRIPPSAGSASGVLPNPVGYNRVYVRLDEPFARDTWFRGLSKGRCFVTNGPLLVVTANGQHPGTVFKADSKQAVNLSISLATQDHVRQLEVISNGTVLRTIECSDEQKQQHDISVEFSESGWFLVRAIADRDETFRFASTAPFYVEVGDKPRRVSRKSADFFIKWVDDRIEGLKRNLSDASELEEVLEHHLDAKAFWARRLESANFD